MIISSVEVSPLSIIPLGQIYLTKGNIIFKPATVVFTIFALLLILFACSPNFFDLVRNYAAVYNTHNVDEIISRYAEDAVFKVSGQFSISGINQVRDIAKYDSVLNIHMSIFNIKGNGDTVSCELSETNDWLKTAGIGEANYTVKFVFEDGLIKYPGAETKQGTQQAFRRVLSSLTEWAKEDRANLLAEMMPDGRFIYNAENAAKTLALLREWKNRLQK